MIDKVYTEEEILAQNLVIHYSNKFLSKNV